MNSVNASFVSLETLIITENKISLDNIEHIMANKKQVSPVIRNLHLRPQLYEINPHKMFEAKMKKFKSIVK